MSFGAPEPNPIVCQQLLVFVHTAREHVDEILDAFLPAARRFQSQAPDAEITGHHALARVHFENAQDVLSLAEAVEEYRHGPNVYSVRAQPYQVAVKPRQLSQHHALPLRHGRNL
jgi:hypothetical protein